MTGTLPALHANGGNQMDSIALPKAGGLGSPGASKSSPSPVLEQTPQMLLQRIVDLERRLAQCEQQLSALKAYAEHTHEYVAPAFNGIAPLGFMLDHLDNYRNVRVPFTTMGYAPPLRTSPPK